MRQAARGAIVLKQLPNGNYSHEPIAEDEAVGACGAHPGELRMLAGLMKGGNINQGYAQCIPDQLTLKLARGECSVDRVQCREQIMLEANAVAIGGLVVHTITPVGPSFARELLTTFNAPDVAATEFTPVVEQIDALGSFALTTRVISDGAGQPAQGFDLVGFGPDFQNYVLPSGIVFDSSNPLRVSIRNTGAAIGSYRANMSLDQIRAG